MNAGDLNKRITIQQVYQVVNEGETNTNGFNENGFNNESWREYATVWAGVSNVFSTEITKFTIRYLPGLNKEMRILFQGKQYSITYIDNVNYRNVYMTIKAVEVV